MKLKQIVLVMFGFLFLGLGLLGIVLPVLPTTPFLLLTAGCFSASSPRFYNWLIRNRIFGPYIENYRTGGGITRTRKMCAIAFLWLGLVISMLIVKSVPITVILVLVGAGVTAHLVCVRTKVE
jgi:uncharacterized membrane protein YbaN (DUF454 family)